MRTIAKEINLFAFEELGETVQKRLIEEEKERIIDARFNFAEEDAKELLKSNYNIDAEKLDISYSISYCQGNGFCFYNYNIFSYSRMRKNENLNAFEKWALENLNKEEKASLFDYLNCNYNLTIKKTSYNYEHAWTCDIDYESFYSSDDNNYIEKMDAFIYDLCKRLFENVYIKICSELENYLYSFYDVSDEEAIESIKVNEYEFLEDGSVYNE